MERNIYKLALNAKQTLLALACTLCSYTVYSQTTYTFVYTGNTQTISLPPGSYSIEMWGADGGGATNGTTPMPGGKGGYSNGIYTLAATTTLNVYVGGHGGNATAANCGGGGGGMSDISTASNTNVIIIAAGGGGGGTSGTASEWSTGGDGGGLTGGGAIDGTGVSTGTAATGGSQTAGGFAVAGSYGAGTPGGLGYGGGAANGGVAGLMHGAGGSGGNGGTGGWNGGGGGCTLIGGNDHAAGGGAGYYGGGGGRGDGGAGGGGSGYIGGVSTGTTFIFGQSGYVANPDVTANGLVLIKELCNITLTHNGAGTQNVAQMCSGQSLTLTTNAVSNYSWTTGATTSSIVVAPTSNTVYGLTATSQSACVASAQLSVVVSGAPPVLSITQSTNQTCFGKTATLTASGAITYTWSNGVTNGVSFFPSATTTYSVIGENGCGTVQAVSTITVSPLPLSVVSSGTAVCTNKTATLSASSPGATSYTWNPGNTIGSSPNLIVNPQSNTMYTISATDGTCVGVTNVAIQADPVPTITSAASATIICPGGTVNLSATGGINYTWTPVNLNGSSITVSPTASTLYNVQGDNSFGCYSSSSQVIVVGTQPTLVASSNALTICNGSSATLTASGANSYAWTGGSTTNTYVVSPTQATTYTVVGTNTASGCTDMKTVSVGVFSPTFVITGNSTICNGASANLSANGGVSYTWNPGGLPFQAVSVSPSSNLVYTVSGVASQGALNCAASATVEVTVNPTPTITSVASPTAICPKQTATITANGAITYTWVGTNTTVVNSSINVTAPAVSILSYTLTGTNAQGCESSITVPFSVSACTGISQNGLLNNQFSVYPNPSNGEFVITGEKEMDLKVFNELGQVVKVIRLSEHDNYKASISAMPSGIYFIVGDNISSKIVVNK